MGSHTDGLILKDQEVFLDMRSPAYVATLASTNVASVESPREG